MTINTAKNQRVLAIDPSEMGFGFAVLEGPRSLIDWGLKGTPKNVISSAQKNNHLLKRIEELIVHYGPDVVVIEDYLGEGSHRRSRISKLLQRISKLGSQSRIKVIAYSKARVREMFAPFDIHNKSERAARIAGWLPELTPTVPKYRKAWMSEDNRMAIFDAIALALVFYGMKEKVETSQTLNEKELQTTGN